MIKNQLAGKTIVITGATSGIGREVAFSLASAGARILHIARDNERARSLLASLPPAAVGKHQSYIANLLSLSETARIAAEIASSEFAVDILINNAGAEFPTHALTDEGMERTFALNYMSYFVLTMGLIDKLKASEQGRVVSTSSRMHAGYKLDFSDLQMTRKYEGYTAYGRSKLCNILFTRALARRLSSSRVTVNALHPGFVATGFGDNDTSVMGTVFRWMKVFAMSPGDGAKTTIHVATSVEGGTQTGCYFVKGKPGSPSAAAQSDTDAERLWTISEELAARCAQPGAAGR